MGFKLFHNDYWPTAQAARVALLEEEATFTLETVDVAGGGLSSPTFLELSPTGTLPVLVDDAGPGGSFTTWDTIGVTTYLNDKRVQGQQSPIHYPVCPDGRPTTYAWTSWAQAHLVPAMETMLLHGKLFTGPRRDAAKMGPALQQFKDALGVLERHISPNSFINHLPNKQNGLFSFADMLVGSTLTYGRLVPQLKMKLDDFPKTYAYLLGLEARDSFKVAFTGITLERPPIIEFPQ